jgi:hypothetical protein
MAWLTTSLLVNVFVLVPVTGVLLLNRRPAVETWGERQPGRQILLAVYLSILALSIALLIIGEPRMAAGLLLAQIVYKVLTPFTVGSLRHPVVISNLAIAALHAVTVSRVLAMPAV